MTRGKLLSTLDIAQELNTGKVTIKFLLKRFKKWLPHEIINGIPYYLPKSLKIIMNILEFIETGMLPKEIDDFLETQSDSDTDQPIPPAITLLQDEDIRLNKEGVVLLKSLFSELGEQQKRIAIAHEKRAAAEERKAIAIEKRAEAEEKKAEAMNNIAAALQEMNRFRGGGTEVTSQKIAHQAARALILDETDPTFENHSMSDVSAGSNTIDDYEETVSDISDLIDEKDLIESFATIDTLSDSLGIETEDQLDCFNGPVEIDDLSLLIENEFQEGSSHIGDLDDLSALLGSNNDFEEIAMDDLSVLIDKEPLEYFTTNDIDDLSLLIDEQINTKNIIHKPIQNNPEEFMDDLTLLITPDDTLMDDLSLLIKTDRDLDTGKSLSPQMDDLSKLINIDIAGKKEDTMAKEEDLKEFRIIKINFSPDDDMEKYKATLMKIILELKTEGYDAEETTLLLNKNMIRTLSGKPEWSIKAISQIYKFMSTTK